MTGSTRGADKRVTRGAKALVKAPETATLHTPVAATRPRRQARASLGAQAIFTLSKSFIFEAAHTLERPGIDTFGRQASRRVHGHSYRATVHVRGVPDPATGMLIDLGVLDNALARVRARLDHWLLDDVAGLGPATLENLCSFIWRELAPFLPGLARVTVSRDMTGDACSLTCD